MYLAMTLNKCTIYKQDIDLYFNHLYLTKRYKKLFKNTTVVSRLFLKEKI